MYGQQEHLMGSLLAALEAIRKPAADLGFLVVVETAVGEADIIGMIREVALQARVGSRLLVVDLARSEDAEHGGRRS